ncbi:hypothetical protein BN903_2 [Halorubrum sp. AJ67]|nr:hypothetical protein BN903_2 [Halorubrum sp. AJ67]
MNLLVTDLRTDFDEGTPRRPRVALRSKRHPHDSRWIFNNLHSLSESV